MSIFSVGFSWFKVISISMASCFTWREQHLGAVLINEVKFLADPTSLLHALMAAVSFASGSELSVAPDKK